MRASSDAPSVCKGYFMKDTGRRVQSRLQMFEDDRKEDEQEAAFKGVFEGHEKKKRRDEKLIGSLLAEYKSKPEEPRVWYCIFGRFSA